MKNYVDDRTIGQGGFAQVSIVRDESKNEYAKKVYSPMANILNAVGDDHLKKRFKREVKYQSKVNHRNVVPVIESHLEEDPPFFIMPLANCTLQQELATPPLSSNEVKRVLFDILAGLECMHELGYVHRDLKPANVLKFGTGEDAYYSISDFGLMSMSESESSTLTGSNASGGTQNYAAPELMRNFRAATHLADIYSVGAILHDLFGNGARRIPYTELTVPGPIGEIILKCTKTNAARRYRSISTLRDSLYGVLDETEIRFNSSREEEAVEILKSTDELTDTQWDNVFLLFEDSEESFDSCANIFSSITYEHISQLKDKSPELFIALGHYYASYIHSNSPEFKS